MNYKIFIFIIFIFVLSCDKQSKKINYSKKFKNYSNKGFTLIYDENYLKTNLLIEN